ncbi:MAG: Heparinase family protein [Hyphomicrobiales bacterium]|nr:Heparinase family protein [Hyphomicrobiales bacterium]
MLLRSVSDWRTRGPQRLVIAPQDIRTSDPTIADDIYAGFFALGSRIVDTRGASPFGMASPSDEWEMALMGFGWLRHLRAADSDLARRNARALVSDWMAAEGRPGDSLAWRPSVVARRLLSWVSQSPLLLEGADAEFYRRFLRGLGRHILFLRAEMRGGLSGEARLFAAIALTQATLCSEGYTALRKRAGKWLAEELTRQILPDGGHIGRNPQTLIDLMLDLLPLRQAYAARNVAAPQELISAVDRMMPMLRLFRHPDSSLALFNGMGVTAPDTLATVLAYDDARALPIMDAPFSGYQRIDFGSAVLIMDTGAPPPPDYSAKAHAGTLSFELSLDNQRLVVNCGAPTSQRGALRDAARTTAAHSTLVIADRASSRLPEGASGGWLGGRIVNGPTQVAARRLESAEEIAIEASHNGYGPAFGLAHERRIAMSADGRRVGGTDRLRPVKAKTEPAHAPYAIRFHLHPGVKAASIENEQAALLVLPHGQHWVFHAAGLTVSVEESAYFAAADGVRATQQIVVHGDSAEQPEVNWAFMPGR